MVLTKLPGVTERMASKMKEHFGSEEAVVSTLASGDVGRLAEVEGLSVKRALSLARSYAGGEGGFLATKEAQKLHQHLLAHIQSFASCSATRERMGLLMPVAAEPSLSFIVEACQVLAGVLRNSNAWKKATNENSLHPADTTGIGVQRRTTRKSSAHSFNDQCRASFIPTLLCRNSKQQGSRNEVHNEATAQAFSKTLLGVDCPCTSLYCPNFSIPFLWCGHQLRGLQSNDTLPARHSIQIPCDATPKGVLTSNAARAEPAKGVAAPFSDAIGVGGSDDFSVSTRECSCDCTRICLCFSHASRCAESSCLEAALTPQKGHVDAFDSSEGAGPPDRELARDELATVPPAPAICFSGCRSIVVRYFTPPLSALALFGLTFTVLGDIKQHRRCATSSSRVRQDTSRQFGHSCVLFSGICRCGLTP